MKHSIDRYSRSVFRLAAGFFYVAVILRAVLITQNNPELPRVIGILLAWLLLAGSEPAVSRKWAWYFPFYLVCQTSLVFFLLSMPGFPDFYATLLMILSIQVMLRLNPKLGAFWIILCSLLIELVLVRTYGSQAIALTLVYTAGNIFMGSYALATRRAQAARVRNQALAQQIQTANLQLHAYSAQLEGMAVARERNRLARELHDSVTQTVFSMMLVIRSALMLLGSDSNQDKASAQIARLGQLAQSALSETQLLISHYQPEKIAEEALSVALHRHLADCRLPESFQVSVDIEGSHRLGAAEERCLFRIIQEALNNIIKHAQVSQAQIRLHLEEPFWVEIADRGIGFALPQALTQGGVGLASMSERADEIGWGMNVHTAPGAGTRIRVEKGQLEGFGDD